MTTRPEVYFLLVFLGSSLGGVGRHVVSGFVARRVGERFPFGTLAVNGSGAFLIGFAAGSPWAVGGGACTDAVTGFLMVGFLGGYTTVSSFSLNTLALAQNRQWRAAAANIAASWLVCLGAAAGGLACAIFVFAPL
jgi:fluoride exporter